MHISCTFVSSKFLCFEDATIYGESVAIKAFWGCLFAGRGDAGCEHLHYGIFSALAAIKLALLLMGRQLEDMC